MSPLRDFAGAGREQNMGELWCRRVEGNGLRVAIVAESDRVVVSTDAHTLTVDLQGEVVDRRERRDTSPPPSAPGVRLGNYGYAVQDGELLRFDADGTMISRTPIAPDLFERHRERLSSAFHPDTPAEAVSKQVNHWIDAGYRTGYLIPDPARERLLSIGQFPPWLAAIRTDGTVAWARIVGKTSDCCNFLAVASRDGTLAHVSSCGWRLTFVTAEGEILSTHDFGPAPDFQGSPNDVSTEGRGVAYVTLLERGVAALRPTLGQVGALEIPGIQRATVRNGVLYCIVKDPADGTLLKAFEAPA
jgi:hypothetical protein